MVGKISNKGICSSLQVCVISSSMIALYIRCFLGISEGIADLIILFSFSFSFCFIYSNENFRLPKKNILLILGIILFCLLGILKQISLNIVFSYLFNIVAIAGTALLVTSLPVRQEEIVKGVMIMGVIFWFIPRQQFFEMYTVNRGTFYSIKMDASYALTPAVIATVIHLFYYRKKKIEYIVLYSMNALLGIRLVLYGTRGILLIMAMAITLLFYDKCLKKHMTLCQKYILCILIAFVGLYLAINLDDIVALVYQFLNKNNISVSAITKTYYALEEESGILNGRGYIWLNSFNMIKKNLLFGNGIGGFYNYYQTWPHNLFLQILLEFGLIFGGCFILYVVKIIIVVIEEKSKIMESWRPVLYLLLLNSLPKLLVSSYLWKDLSFWLFVFYVAQIHTKQSKGYCDEKNRNFNIS